MVESWIHFSQSSTTYQWGKTITWYSLHAKLIATSISATKIYVTKMQLLLSVTFLIFFAVYWVVCVQWTHSSSGDGENIFITHLIVISKSWMCVCSYFTTIFSQLLFPLPLCNLWCVKVIGYIMARRSYLFVCTLHSLSSLYRLIWMQ